MSDKLAPNIAVVAEDKTINAKICNIIERYGFDVIRIFNPSHIKRLVEFNEPHVAIVTSNIISHTPNEAAEEFREAMESYEIPIIFLLNKDHDAPGDEYCGSKLAMTLDLNCTPNQLMIAIQDLLRKAKPKFQNKIASYQNLSLDLSTERVMKDGKRYPFGPTEFKILKLFMKKPHNVFTRRQIIDYIWGTDNEIADRTIDVHINRIRKMLKVHEDINPLIKTIRSGGYCLDLKD
ncbi:MAG: hypothetical protein DGJ47_000008 [Rickettsiaceae bacterium]